MDEIQKATINIINKNGNKCFHNAATVALDHKDIITNSERILKIKPFICTYNWEGIKYSSEKDD